MYWSEILQGNSSRRQALFSNTALHLTFDLFHPSKGSIVGIRTFTIIKSYLKFYSHYKNTTSPFPPTLPLWLSPDIQLCIYKSSWSCSHSEYVFLISINLSRFSSGKNGPIRAIKCPLDASNSKTFTYYIHFGSGGFIYVHAYCIILCLKGKFT